MRYIEKRKIKDEGSSQSETAAKKPFKGIQEFFKIKQTNEAAGKLQTAKDDGNESGDTPILSDSESETEGNSLAKANNKPTRKMKKQKRETSGASADEKSDSMDISGEKGEASKKKTEQKNQESKEGDEQVAVCSSITGEISEASKNISEKGNASKDAKEKGALGKNGEGNNNGSQNDENKCEAESFLL